MVLISVVIPVFNVEKYVERCIKSVIEQSYENWEIILVDDGSPDDSGAICDSYASRYPNIHVIHQINGGVTSARRCGVCHSNGEWITFVDSDDYLPKDTLRLFSDKIGDDVDIIVGRMEGQRELPYDRLSIQEYRRRIIEADNVVLAPFCHLFRKNLFDDLFALEIPREINKGEDIIMNTRLAYKTVKDVAVVLEPIYCYYNNPNSVTRTRKVANNHNLDGQLLYYKYWEDSIPLEDKFLYEKGILQYKVGGLRGDLLNFAKEDMSFLEHDFYRQVVEDIRKKHFKINLLTYGVFFIKNLKARIFWRFVYRVCNHIFWRVTGECVGI